MRRQEVLTLKWYQIRNGWIDLPKKKTGKKRVPVSESLEELFNRIRESQSPNKGNVCDLNGKQVEAGVSPNMFLRTRVSL